VMFFAVDYLDLTGKVSQGWEPFQKMIMLFCECAEVGHCDKKKSEGFLLV